MRVITDRRGPTGSDETSRDLCHFENPQTPKVCEVIDFLLTHRSNWGSLEIHESYDRVNDALGRLIASFKYNHGALIKSTSFGKFENGHYVEDEDIEALKEKRVELISIVGGWTRYDYHVCLIE